MLYELEHEELARTCEQCLKQGGVIYCSFQLHDPSQRERNLAFFQLARGEPFCLESTELSRIACPDPLSEDYGLGKDAVSDEVHIYKLTRVKPRGQ